MGARPQFIKAAAVSRALRHVAKVQEMIVHTGQHYDAKMSDIFFQELGLASPEHNLGIGSGTHGFQTGRMLEAIESVLMATLPDWVMVYGDTNSTLAGALAAAKLHVPVAHVEAGLRGFNRRSPEEVNRILTDHVSDLLFVPSTSAARNLLREGIEEERICLTGDVMYDSVLHYSGVAASKSTVLDRLDLQPKTYVLATVHRAENTDDTGRLRAIWTALNAISHDVPVVMPIHPRTSFALRRERMMEGHTPSIRVIEPVGYLDMLALEQNACLVVSDSGGVPKEAYFLGVPSVMLRAEAVWVELVEMKWAEAVDPRAAEDIIDAIGRVMSASRRIDDHPYGDGRAAERIAGILLRQ